MACANHIGKANIGLDKIVEMYFEIMLAISDRFAFCKHRIRLGQLHKCDACEMCGFIYSSSIGIIVIRNIKIMKREEFVFYHQSLFGRCQFNSWFLCFGLHFEFTHICCANITRYSCNQSNILFTPRGFGAWNSYTQRFVKQGHLWTWVRSIICFILEL